MILFGLAWIGTGCWIICFWWMYRISSRQNSMLKELQEMTKRVEDFSKAEHDLIRDVHPKVSQIKEHVENVAKTVAPDASRSR